MDTFIAGAAAMAGFMAVADNRVTLMLALDPSYWRAGDKIGWAQSLVGAVETGAPYLLQIEKYEIQDTMLYVEMRTTETQQKLRKLLRDDDGLIRLRARLADMGARPRFEFER